jgi:hypothetical protein
LPEAVLAVRRDDHVLPHHGLGVAPQVTTIDSGQAVGMWAKPSCRLPVHKAGTKNRDRKRPSLLCCFA